MNDHALDTALPMTEADLNLLDKVDEVLEAGKKNPQIMFNYMMALRKMSQASGLALAKLIHDGEKIWQTYESDDDWPTMVMTQAGIGDQTYNKYYRVWAHVVQHPHLMDDAYLQAQILKKPIGGLILLIAAAREDQITPKDWEDIANAPDVKTLRDIRARIRGHEGAASTTIRIRLLKDGTLQIRKGGGHYENKAHVIRDGSELSDALISRLESIGCVVEPI